MAEEEAPQDGQSSSGSSKKLLLLIAVLVLLLAGGGVAAYFLLSGSSSEPTGQAEQQRVRQEAIYVKLRTLGGKPSIIVNFTEKTGRQRFLQVHAEAMTREESVADALTKHMPLVVHEMSTLFAAQTFKQLQTAEGKERLRKEATRKVQEILQREIGRPGVEEVFFTNFVMQ